MQFLTFAAASTLLTVTSASIYPTAPVASTSWPSGTNELVTWTDDGKTPTLSNIQRMDLELWAGSATQQIMLAVLDTNVSAVATQKTINVPANVGPNGNFYLLRFHATGSDNATTDIFTTFFSLTGMTGQFNSTVLSQIGLASSTASSGTQTSGAATSTTTGKSSSAGSTVTTTLVQSASATQSGSSSASSNDKSGASHNFPKAILPIVGLVTLGLAML